MCSARSGQVPAVADAQIDAQLAVLLHSLTTMRTPEPGFSFAELRKAEPVVIEQTIMDVVFKELCRQVGAVYMRTTAHSHKTHAVQHAAFNVDVAFQAALRTRRAAASVLCVPVSYTSAHTALRDRTALRRMVRYMVVRCRSAWTRARALRCSSGFTGCTRTCSCGSTRTTRS